MRKLIKSLFLPLAVFAMLGLGTLTLSASNVTNDVVTKTEDASMQDVYTGNFFIYVGGIYEEIDLDEKPEHCTLDEGSNIRCSVMINGVSVELYGEEVGPPTTYKPLYELL